MQNFRLRGMFSPAVLAMGLLMIFFIANSATLTTRTDNTMLKIQAARENTIATESAIRAIDKAFAKGVYVTSSYDRYGTPPECKSNFDVATINSTILSAIEELGNKYSLTDCTVTYPTATFPNTSINISTDRKKVNVYGKVECITMLGDNQAVEARDFNTSKTIVTNGANCEVTDDVSGCTEQPNFSCA